MEACIKEVASEYLTINTPQMVEVDRLMMNDYQIGLVQMMENAGRSLAIVAREKFLKKDPQGKRIAVLAGTGDNGGGALVCARRLHNWGANVEVFMTDTKEKMTPMSRHQRSVLQRIGVPVQLGIELPGDVEYDLIIDGIIGYSTKRNPNGLAMEMIHWINSGVEKVLSLDIPSGLNLTSRKLNDVVVCADATLTLAMPKKGMFTNEAKKNIGALYLGDISVPLEVYREDTLSLEATNIFRYSDIVKIY